jgi:hypothetical protein
MNNEEKIKKIKAEIDLLYSQLEELETDNEIEQDYPDEENEVNSTPHIQSDFDNPNTLSKRLKFPSFSFPQIPNFRLILIVGLVLLFLSPVIKSLVEFGIEEYRKNTRDGARIEILNTVGYKFEEFNIAYQLYPFMIGDGNIIKVYSDSIRNRQDEILVPAQTQLKLDVREYGFDKLEIGRTGCQVYPETTSPTTLWICFEQNTKQLGVVLEKSPNSLHLISL